jgi:hypothetical protein
MLWYLLAVAFVVFAVIVPIYWGIWSAHRLQSRALALLRTYAERGEEPPPSVLEAVARRPAHVQPGQRAPKHSRAAHLEQFIYSATMAGVAAAIAWWRQADGSGPQWFVYAAGIFAIVLGVTAFAHLLAAISTPDHDG